MEPDQIIKYIESPSSLGKKELTHLKELLNKYPYFQTAHLLFIKSAHNVNDVELEHYLVKSSAFINDRTVLHKLLSAGEPEYKTEIVKESDISSENIQNQAENLLETQNQLNENKENITNEISNISEKQEEKIAPDNSETKTEITQQTVNIKQEDEINEISETALLTHKNLINDFFKPKVEETKTVSKQSEEPIKKTTEEKIETKTINISDPLEKKKLADDIFARIEALKNEKLPPKTERKTIVPAEKKEENLESKDSNSEKSEREKAREERMKKREIRRTEKENDSKSELKTETEKTSETEQKTNKSEQQNAVKDEFKQLIAQKLAAIKEAEQKQNEIPETKDLQDLQTENEISVTEEKIQEIISTVELLEESKIEPIVDIEISNSPEKQESEIIPQKTESEINVIDEQKIEIKAESSELTKTIESSKTGISEISAETSTKHEEIPVIEKINDISEINNIQENQIILEKVEQKNETNIQISTETIEQKAEQEIQVVENKTDDSKTAEQETTIKEETKKDTAQSVFERIAQFKLRNKQKEEKTEIPDTKSEQIDTQQEISEETVQIVSEIKEHENIKTPISEIITEEQSENEIVNSEITQDSKTEEISENNSENIASITNNTEQKTAEIIGEESTQTSENGDQNQASEDELPLIGKITDEDLEITENATNEAENDKNRKLIEKFIETEPKIDAKKTPAIEGDASLSGTKLKAEIVTELMANIYINQGYYDKAIVVFEKLILKYPKKKSYFASKIEELKKMK